MGVNDAKEQLEVAIEEFGKLERKLAAVEAERDAALSVIEQVGRALTETDVRYEERNQNAFAIIAQSPASALAKVKADALREASDSLSDPSKSSGDERWFWRLRAEADRIEKEAKS